MELSLIYDGRGERWIGRVGGVEVPLPLFGMLAGNLRAHYEIMRDDIMKAVGHMRKEYAALKQSEMSVQKGKNSAAEFKALRLRQEKQLKAIQTLENEAQIANSKAEYFKSVSQTVTDVGGQNDPRYVIRG